MLTRSLRADLGVMISASHNPYEDNGIKLFGPDGYKLSDATEAEIEALMASDLSARLSKPAALGRASRLTDAAGRYIEGCQGHLPPRPNPGGLEDRGGLRPRRRLQGGTHRAVGARRHRDGTRREAGRVQHQPRLRLHRADGTCAVPSWNMAPTLAWRWMAMRTGC